MKMHITSAAAGFLLLAGIGAAAAEDVVIAPEQETVIKEYVHKQPLASIQVPGVELSVGSVLPDTVELHEVPNVKYRYVVVDNQTVIVDPGTRVTCTFEALDKEFAIVGWKVVHLPPANERNRVLTERLRTSAPAESGLIGSCWLT